MNYWRWCTTFTRLNEVGKEVVVLQIGTGLGGVRKTYVQVQEEMAGIGRRVGD